MTGEMTGASTEIRSIAVLGAGTMGHGIAHVAAVAGYRTHLFDIDGGAVERGLAAVHRNLQKGVDRGKVSDEVRQEALSRLSSGTDLGTAVSDADLVIEAAPERLELKRKIVAEVTALAPEHAIFGTNTSSLSVTEIASAASRPERVLGMHFFNPPHILKLLEIVRAEQTQPEVVETIRGIGYQYRVA